MYAIKKWAQYGIPVSIWFVAMLLMPFLDRFFINYFLTSKDLGIYSSLQELLTRFFSLTLFPLTLAIHPRIMTMWNQSKFNSVLELLSKCIVIILTIGILFLVFIWKFNDFIFFGIGMTIPQFGIEYKNLILPLICTGFLWQLSLLTHKMLELNQKTLNMVIAILPSIIINIIGNTFFITSLGPLATAYTSFFSALSYFLITGTHFIITKKRMSLI